MLVLDSGGVTLLAERSSRSAALYRAIRKRTDRAPVVPSIVLTECLTGDARRDVRPLRLLRDMTIVEEIPRELAVRAAQLRTQSRRGSAVDAIVVASAEPGGRCSPGKPRISVGLRSARPT